MFFVTSAGAKMNKHFGEPILKHAKQSYSRQQR